MRKLFFFSVALLPVAASVQGAIVYDSTGSVDDEFVTSIRSIYFDDATTVTSAPYQINQFNIGYENFSFSDTSFDLLVQFYNNVDYGAAYGTPIGTNPIGGLIDITGLNVAAGALGQTGLISLSGNLPVATSSTIGYEFEFVKPGATSFSESSINSSLLPIFRHAAPVVGSNNPYFAYDFLKKDTIVGDAATGDIFTFPNPSSVAAQIGAVAVPAITVAAGQNYTISASSASGVTTKSIAGITVNAGGILSVAPGATQSSRQLISVTSPGLTIAGSSGNWTGLVDLANNDLDLPGASLAAVTDQVRQGYAGGSWKGTGGITSSTAATTPLTTLGVIQNNQAGSAIYSSFDGSPVGASDVLVKYTYFGDANLDGQVDGSDYTKIDNGFNSHLTGWLNGDFNYDGVVDGSDYTLIDNAFNSQGASLASQIAPSAGATAQFGSASVPEPTALAILATGTLAMLRRRKTVSR